MLGTAAYMSPEQARGRSIDKRTDIWAFGCVLFEMLTGSPVFARETITDTVAAVVGTEPEWASLPADTPGSIRRVLTRCLQKDARRRLHDIADARIEIEDATTTSADQPRDVRRRWSRLTLAALCLGIATAVVLLWVARGRLGRPAERSLPDTRVIRLTDLPGLEESPAISADGKSVVFTAGVGGKRQLFVRLVAGGAPRIPASRVPLWQIVNPALSPDGKWLAQALTDGFTTNVWALSTTSDEWRQITDFGERTTFIARRVSWSSDGRTILAAVGEGDSDIVLLEGLTDAGRK